MISELDLTQEQKIYIENLEKVKKTTTDEFTLKLIDAFFHDLNSIKFKFSSFIDCVENYIFSKDSYTLDEIFPKALYSTLDLFMGTNGREDFLEVVRNIRKFPYGSNIYNQFRSENYRLYSKKIAEVFEAFTEKKFKNLSLIDILKEVNSELVIAGLFLEIDRGNQEIINIVEEMVLGDNTSFVFSEFVIEEIFRSNNKYLVELLGKILLEADLQEGLRQVICKKISVGTIENFKYMFGIIYENNLIRYSSISYSLEKIFNFSEIDEKIYKINEKDMQIVYSIFIGEQSVEELIKSNNIKKIYFGLWYTGIFNIRSALDKLLEILKNKNEDKMSLVLYFLRFIEGNLRNEIACKIILKNEDNIDIVSSICEKIFDFQLSKVGNLLERNNIVKEKTLKYYFGNTEIAKKIFNIVHKLLDRNFKDDFLVKMFTIAILEDNKEMFDICRSCIKFAEFNTKEEILKNILAKSKNEKDFQFIVSMLRDDILFWKVSKIIEENNLQIKYSKEIENTIKFQTILRHREKLEKLLYLRSDKEVLLSIFNLLSSGNKNAILAGFNLIVKSIDENRFSYERLVCFEKYYELIIEMLADKEVFYEAFKIAKRFNLYSKYAGEIESLFKIRNEEIRQGLVELLYLQSDEEVLVSISNLVSSKNGVVRLGGLELIILCLEEYRFSIEKLSPLAKSIKKPTISESDLLKKIFEEDDVLNCGVEFLYDRNYEIELELSQDDRKSIKDLSEIFPERTEKIKKIIQKFEAFVEKHKDYKYKSSYGSALLFGCSYRPLKLLIGDENSNLYYSTEEYLYLDEYPLAYELKKFYEEEIDDISLLWQLNILMQNFNKWEQWYRYRKTKDNEYYRWNEKHYKWIKNNLGIDIVYLRNWTQEQNFKYINFNEQFKDGIRKIVEIMFNTYEKIEKQFFFERLKSIGVRVLETFDFFDNYIDWYILFNTKVFDIDFSKFDMNPYKDNFRIVFTLRVLIENKIKKVCDKKYHKGELFQNFSDIEFAYACLFNIIKKDGYFKYLIYYQWLYRELDKIQNIVLDKISMLCKGIPFERDYRTRWMFRSLIILPQNITDFIKENGQKAINHVADMEISRGEDPTEFSALMPKIERIQGVKFFARILKVLNEDFFRSNKYAFRSSTKRYCLSVLLKVSEPYENEDYEAFEKEIKNYEIPDRVLVRAAVFSKKWIPFISKYLGWDGFESGCYYFIAYTGEIDEKYIGTLSKYTPLSIEDLELGILDINWFKEVYEKLGKERFELLYDSAKYISEGNKHIRARLLSDGVNGKITINEAENVIIEKRNRDMLLTYGVIPLEGEEDLIHRYEFIQEFLEKSKEFGAQRRTSEARAVKVALENLARNAGYEDTIRFIWWVECKLFKERKEYFSPKTLDDISVYIKISEEGKAEIICEKGDKKLKSIPASIKKDSYVLELKDIVKELKNQYNRSRKTLEDAMENQIMFCAKDLRELLKHPIIYPLIKNLVFTKESSKKLELGFYREGNLISYDGKSISLNDNEKLRLSHCLDLYNSGDWSNYQKYLFDNKIQQPFKQIFRELYVKTEDERNKYYSLRYEGHRVYVKKVAGALKNRNWIMAEEFEGLQKVYYKENIIAKIYARANWIYPSYMESTTLEDVVFYDRNTFKEKRIEDVPDIIFSEVMRDIDLAVSVGYFGEVSPETSQSTIEMRKSIAELTVKLFKLENVSFVTRFVKIKGVITNYSIHLGSGVIHQEAGAEISVLPVSSKYRGKIFLPFVDGDPKTSEILSKILLFAEDNKIKDPSILNQIKRDNN